jgi:hypothetical protein
MIYKKLMKLQILSMLNFAKALNIRGNNNVTNIVLELVSAIDYIYFYSDEDLAYFSTLIFYKV